MNQNYQKEDPLFGNPQQKETTYKRVRIFSDKVSKYA